MNSSKHPTFKVNVSLSIWSHEESVVQAYLDLDDDMPRSDLESDPSVTILRKELELPFAPFPGLELQTEDWECGQLEFVKWDEENWEFRCTVSDEYPLQELDTYLSYEDLLSKNLEEGWVR